MVSENIIQKDKNFLKMNLSRNLKEVNQEFNQLVFLHDLILHGLMKMVKKISKISVVSIIAISVQMKLTLLVEKWLCLGLIYQENLLV